MREIRLSGLEGGVAVTRHPYPYFIAPHQPHTISSSSGAACLRNARNVPNTCRSCRAKQGTLTTELLPICRSQRT